MEEVGQGPKSTFEKETHFVEFFIKYCLLFIVTRYVTGKQAYISCDYTELFDLIVYAIKRNIVVVVHIASLPR